MIRFGFAISLGLLCTEAHAQVTGQTYQLPAGFESYPAETPIEYGGWIYVSQGNGTMVAGNAAPSNTAQSGQAYQIPAGYESYPAGTLIAYGGNNYVIQGDGTMLAVSTGGSVTATGDADNSGGNTTADNSGYYVPDNSSPDSSGYADDSSGYLDNTPYQIPSGYDSYSAAGTPISYGGYNYIAQGDGTMLMLNPGPGLGYSSIRFQIPAGYAGLPVGSAINYGGASYVVNSGGTMSRVNPKAQPFRTGSTGVQPYRPNTVRTGPGPQVRPGGTQPGYANTTRPGHGPQIRPNTTGTTAQHYRPNVGAPTRPGLRPEVRPNTTGTTVQHHRPNVPVQPYRPTQTNQPNMSSSPSRSPQHFGGGGYSRGYSRPPSMPTMPSAHGGGRR